MALLAGAAVRRVTRVKTAGRCPAALASPNVLEFPVFVGRYISLTLLALL